MKKSAKVLAFGLAGIMVLPMSSCKKKDGQKGSQQTQQSAPLVPVATRETQYVQESDPYFTDSEIEFPVPFDETRTMEGMSVGNCKILNDKVYFTFDIQYMLSPEEREERDSLVGKWESESQLRYFELQDSLQECGLVSYSMTGEKVAEFEIAPEESVQGFFSMKDGRIGAFLSEKRYEVNENNNQVEMICGENLVYFSEEGKRLEEFSIEQREQEFLGDRFFELDNGNILVVGDSNVFIMSHEGNILAQDSFNEQKGSAFEEEGKYYILFSHSTMEDDKVKYEKTVREIDTVTAKLGDPKQIDPSIPDYFFDCGDACYSVEDYEPVKKINVFDGTVEELMNYAYTDITPFLSGEVSDFRCDQDTDLYFLKKKAIRGNTSWVQSVPVLVHLHKEEKNPYAGRPILYAATCKTDYDSPFTQAVNAYNKRPESKARIIVYSPETEVPGYGAAQADIADQILLSMKSGNGPDILLNCGEFSQFNSEKILLDLNPYMDGATGINRADYYDNIFRAFEVDGKLYQLPINVQVDGFLGNPDLLSGVSGWTISDFDAEMGNNKNGAYPLLGGSNILAMYWNEEGNVGITEPLGMLNALLAHDFHHYVNYSNCSCSFDSDDFRTLLEIAAKYGGCVDQGGLMDIYDKYDDMSDTDPCAKAMQDGISALTILEFSNLTYFSATSYVCGGAPLYLGWPTSGQSGLGAKACVSVGISAYSKAPEEAWDFVAFLLKEDSLFNDIGGDSYRGGSVLVKRSALDLNAQQELDAYLARVEFYSDEPGMIALDAVLSDESMSKYKEMIGTIHSSIQVDTRIFAIVMEEAPAFFNGQKSADEVSKSIQNRVTTLLQEQG